MSAGFKTVLVANPASFPRIDISINGISVTKGVEHLIKDANRTVVYSPKINTDGKRSISQVWLLGYAETSISSDSDITELAETSHSPQQDSSVSHSHDTLRLSVKANSGKLAEDEREQVIRELIRLLQSEQDALVRSRAAIALGAMGDEQAVAALKSVLADRHSSIRTQAINALSQIGGEQAIATLGTILLHTGTNPRDRVMAAQALWGQESAAARKFLRAGMNDTDRQVRFASANPPPTLTKRPNLIELGDEELQ